MQVDNKAFGAGYLSLEAGQDAGRVPPLIPDNQAQELWNITVRNGFARSRPGFFQHPFSFPTDEIAEWFETNTIQCATLFQPFKQPPVHVWSVGGRIFTIDVQRGGTVVEITPRSTTSTTTNFTVPAVGSSVSVPVSDASSIYAGYPVIINGKEYLVSSVSVSYITVVNVDDTPAAVISSGAVVSYLDANARYLKRAWMLSADRFLIIQDGQSRAIIFDGGKVRRAEPAKQDIPTGTVMAYGLGRIWVAVNKKEFAAGDIIYGPTGTSEYNYADAILKFTENTFLAEGGNFSMPFDSGEITAMEFLPVPDRSTGQGPLMVFSDNIAVSVEASLSRELWKVTSSPINTVFLRGPSAKSAWSTVPIANGDIFFRSSIGIRSIAFARRNFGSWGNMPMSSEMDNVIDDEDQSFMAYSSAIVFHNRLLMSTSSSPKIGDRPQFNGIAVMDFDTISSLQNQSPPVYDGTWVGLGVMQLYSGTVDNREKAFAACRNADGRNELWEITRNNKFDGDDGRIVSTIITKAFFSDKPSSFKRIKGCEIWVDQLVGKVDFTLQYRADGDSCWNDWGTRSVCVQWRTCSQPEDCSLNTYRPGYKTRINFGEPPDTDDTNDMKPKRIGYNFQLKLQWEGSCRLRLLKVKAIEVDEMPDNEVGY